MINKHKFTAIGLIIGSIAGYLYYHFIGCTSGKCPITSSPAITTLYGAIIGALFPNLFNKKDKKSDYKNE